MLVGSRSDGDRLDAEEGVSFFEFAGQSPAERSDNHVEAMVELPIAGMILDDLRFFFFALAVDVGLLREIREIELCLGAGHGDVEKSLVFLSLFAVDGLLDPRWGFAEGPGKSVALSVLIEQMDFVAAGIGAEPSVEEDDTGFQSLGHVHGHDVDGFPVAFEALVVSRSRLRREGPFPR